MAECQHVLSAFWGGTHWLGEWLWAWATAGRWVSRQLCGQWGWVSFRLCSPRQGTLFWHTYWALHSDRCHSSPPSHPLICPGTLQSSTFKEIIPWEEGETYSSKHGKTPLGVDGRPHSTMTEGEECAGAFVLKESAPGRWYTSKCMTCPEEGIVQGPWWLPVWCCSQWGQRRARQGRSRDHVIRVNILLRWG